MKIQTNNHERNILSWWDLTPKEQKEFDYLDPEEGSFFRYHGMVYDLGEFMRIPDCANQRLDPDLEPMLAWDGYQSDSFFSGVLVKYSDDFETIKVGSYCT